MSRFETYKLNVIKTIPESYSLNANVNSNIEIMFNLELNINTIVNNIIILKDKERKYSLDNLDSVVIDKDNIIDVTTIYKNKCVTIRPQTAFEEDCRYLIYIKENSIYDINGKVLEYKYIRYFDTEGTPTIRKCNITYPIDNSINKEVLKIEYENILNANKYLIQVSKSKCFSTLFLEEITDNNYIETNFPDGLYYVRVKALNGMFGDINIFTVKSYKDSTVVTEDHSDDFFYEELVIDEKKLIEFFPKNEDINISEKTNIVYSIFENEIKDTDIDFYDSGIFGELSDEEDEDFIIPHNFVDCVYNIVYNKKEDKTYIVLTPINN